jgi:hypothetical protein
MRKILALLLTLVFALTFTTGCSTLFERKIRSSDVKNTKEASEIKQRASSINSSAEQIRTEVDEAEKEIKSDIVEGRISQKTATPKLQRWQRVDNEAELIEQLSKLNEKSGGKIVSFSMGTWHTTWWFKSIAGFLVFMFILIVSLVATYVAKQWGVISYVRTTNEALADGVAAILDKDPDIDNYSLDEDMHKRIRKNRQK